jgi:hypothetical protein
MSNPKELSIFDLVPNLPHTLDELERLWILLYHPVFQAMHAIEKNPRWPVFAAQGMSNDRLQLVAAWERQEQQLMQQGFTPLEIYAAHLIKKA